MHVVMVLIEQIVLSALLAVRVFCSIDPGRLFFKGVILLLWSASLILLKKQLSSILLFAISPSSELISDVHKESDVVFECDEENISVLDVPIESSDIGLMHFAVGTCGLLLPNTFLTTSWLAKLKSRLELGRLVPIFFPFEPLVLLDALLPDRDLDNGRLQLLRSVYSESINSFVENFLG